MGRAGGDEIRDPQAEAGIQQTIVLLSGDGGLCDIIDAFHSTPKSIQAIPNIALIPAGTGNAMANSIGLMVLPKNPLMALLRGKPIPLPVFVATFSDGARYVQGDSSRVSRIYGCVVWLICWIVGEDVCGGKSWRPFLTKSKQSLHKFHSPPQQVASMPTSEPFS